MGSFNAKMSVRELNVLLNSWPEGTIGNERELSIIRELDKIGKGIGYGALEQLCSGLKEIQCYNNLKDTADFKRHRFQSMQWELPKDFEEIANKKL